MRVIQTIVDAGATKPFTLAHFSDLHLTLADRRDEDETIFMSEKRLRQCRWEFQDSMANYDFLFRYAKDHPDAQLVCTGDLIDFMTERNLESAKKLVDETHCFFAVGNHEFHPTGALAKQKDDPLFEEKVFNEVQKYFPDDLNFAAKERNGVFLAAINNSQYQITDEQLTKLQDVAAQNKPIILLMHNPLYEEGIREASRRDLINKVHLYRPSPFMGIPESARKFYENADFFDEIRPTDATRRACEYIASQPLIKCILTGHLHFDYEGSLNGKLQIMTGVNTLREVIVL